MDFKGWKTKDSYAKNVSFIISNLKINNQIIDAFFKIPREFGFFDEIFINLCICSII